MTLYCICAGLDVQEAGRFGEAPSVGLAKTLETAGFAIGRLKTGMLQTMLSGESGDAYDDACACDLIGTPPRLDGRTVNYRILQPQQGDDPPMPFSFLNNEVAIPVRASVSTCAGAPCSHHCESPRVCLGVQVTEQKPCHMTYTNAAAHQVVLDNMHLNRHVQEEITGVRYIAFVCVHVIDHAVRIHNVTYIDWFYAAKKLLLF